MKNIHRYYVYDSRQGANNISFSIWIALSVEHLQFLTISHAFSPNKILITSFQTHSNKSYRANAQTHNHSMLKIKIKNQWTTINFKIVYKFWRISRKKCYHQTNIFFAVRFVFRFACIVLSSFEAVIDNGLFGLYICIAGNRKSTPKASQNKRDLKMARTTRVWALT